jgi:DNA-binding LacI/PurR family transcriptional regulator
VLAQRGVRIPDDVSLVGTSFRSLNAPEATAHLTPPLTVVTFDQGEMGRRGVRYLVDAVEGRVEVPLRALLPGVVVERQSTAPRLVVA